MGTLKRSSYEQAIAHISKFGDTDIFPHSIEINFLRERSDDIIRELCNLDVNNFDPAQAVETLASKSRYGFRIAHYPNILETLFYTAATIEIGPDLENLKSDGGWGPFAYRFSSSTPGSLFQTDRTFRHWIAWQKEVVSTGKYNQVICTDIADFYQRIYLHRVENCIASATENEDAKSLIERTIKSFRSRQSYGIPVGGSASRIIAEAVIADSDAALLGEGYEFTRFVDDYRIFVKENQNPYEILSFLAEQLFLSEGLTLNGQKTRVIEAAEYEKFLDEELPDPNGTAEAAVYDALSSIVYFDESPDPELIEQLKAVNLLGMLESEMSQTDWDFGKIKALFRALRVTRSNDAAEYITQRIGELNPLAKEVALYFSELKSTNIILPPNLKENILRNLLGNKHVPAITSWYLEMHNRGVISLTNRELTSLDTTNPIIMRQIALGIGRNKEVNYFRRKKTSFDNLQQPVKYAFILAASCLPKDEYRTWVGAIRPRMNRPLDSLYCKWAQDSWGKLDFLLTSSAATGDE